MDQRGDVRRGNPKSTVSVTCSLDQGSSTSLTSSLTSTTSSTTLYELLVVPETLNGTVGGEIITNALQVVVDSLDNDTLEFKASTPTGEVTILKLQPTANANATQAQSDYQNVEATGRALVQGFGQCEDMPLIKFLKPDVRDLPVFVLQFDIFRLQYRDTHTHFGNL